MENFFSGPINWCSVGLLFLYRHLFLLFEETLFFDFTEDIVCAFVTVFFFYAHNSEAIPKIFPFSIHIFFSFSLIFDW